MAIEASEARRRPVVVTGVGPWTPIGCGVDGFWSAVLDGVSGATHADISHIDFRKYKTTIGAPTPDPTPANARVTDKEARVLDPATMLGLAAAALAIEDAGLGPRDTGDKRNPFALDGVAPERVGVVLGTGIGGLDSTARTHARHLSGQPMNGINRFGLPMLIPNAIPAQIAIRYGLHGECKAVVTACAAATMAIGDALRLIRDGELDVVITGGVDRILSCSHGYGLVGFDLLNTMSTRNDDPTRASRPFDADRDGFVLGEGAGVLVLESEAHASARGARAYARVEGYGSTCDAHSIMQLDPENTQIVRAMKRAILDSGRSLPDFRYVNAHGTATEANDVLEATAVRAVFGRLADDLPVNSTKAMTGHAIGASGGIEAIVTALSLKHGVVHRCVNLDRPDPRCEIVLPRENRSIETGCALTNSFGFGGHNASLVFGSV